MANVTVDGGIQRGVGYSGSTALPADVYLGDTTPKTGSKSMPKIFVPPAAVVMPATTKTATAWQIPSGSVMHVQGDLVLDGAQVTVQPDVSGAINPVQIYVDGEVKVINNSQVNVGGKPKNLQIYRVSPTAATATATTYDWDRQHH